MPGSSKPSRLNPTRIAAGAGLLFLAVTVLLAFTIFNEREAPSLSPRDQPLRGILLAISELPDPEQSAYRNCLQVVKMQIPNQPAAENGADAIPEEILVAWSGFKDRKLSPYSELKPGSELEIVALSFAEADQNIRSMQRVDSLEDFISPLFFASRVEVIREPTLSQNQSGAPPSKESDESAVADGKSPRDWQRRPSQHSSSRLAAIKRDRQTIARSLRDHGGEWSVWSDKLVPFYKTLHAKTIDNGGKLQKNGEFFSRSYDHRFRELMSVADQSPALEMIISFDRALADRGIDLIVVPFPFKEEINAHHFDEQAPATGTLSPQRLRLIDWLLERNVEVIDLEPALRQAAQNSDRLFYDYADLHPACDGIEVAAKVIAERLRRYQLPEKWQQLSVQEITFTMPDSYRKRFPHMPEKAEYSALQVVTAEGELLPENTPDSPLLLVGDSFVRAPGLYEVKSSSLREHLAYLTGVLGRDLSVKGGAAQTMLNLQREGPGILADCQVCIFVFAQYPLFLDPDKMDEATPWPVVPLP